jgi:hypothetical protein
MTPSELRAAGTALFGRRTWITRLAKWLEVDRSTVHRWLKGAPIPAAVALAIEGRRRLAGVAVGEREV